jgi:hypothetical protein
MPQVVTPARTLDLDHVSTKIGKLCSQDIPCHQPGEVENTDALKWSFHNASEGSLEHLYWVAPSPIVNKQLLIMKKTIS